MIKFLPFDVLNALYRLRISALASEIFMFEKCVKYANKMTDDVNPILYKKKYYLASLHPRQTIKTW